MDGLSDLEFYQRREREERLRAAAAADPSAGAAHNRLAELYAARLGDAVAPRLQMDDRPRVT